MFRCIMTLGQPRESCVCFHPLQSCMILHEDLACFSCSKLGVKMYADVYNLPCQRTCVNQPVRTTVPGPHSLLVSVNQSNLFSFFTNKFKTKVFFSSSENESNYFDSSQYCLCTMNIFFYKKSLKVNKSTSQMERNSIQSPIDDVTD